MTIVDWDRVEQLYAFSRGRAADRVQRAEDRLASDKARRERQDLHVLEAMYVQARRYDDVVAACAVTYFRAKALRDAHHPDFLGEWIARSA